MDINCLEMHLPVCNQRNIVMIIPIREYVYSVKLDIILNKHTVIPLMFSVVFMILPPISVRSVSVGMFCLEGSVYSPLLGLIIVVLSMSIRIVRSVEKEVIC